MNRVIGSTILLGILMISLLFSAFHSLLPKQKQKQSLKKVPVQAMENFLITKIGRGYELLKAKDVLVPVKAGIYFSINPERSRFFVRASLPNTADADANVDGNNKPPMKQIKEMKKMKKTYGEFEIKAVSLNSTLNSINQKNHVPDIRSGRNLSLILKEKLISVKLVGQAIESGNIGGIIRVRVADLSKNFRVRLLDKHNGEILFQ